MAFRMWVVRRSGNGLLYIAVNRPTDVGLHVRKIFIAPIQLNIMLNDGLHSDSTCVPVLDIEIVYK